MSDSSPLPMTQEAFDRLVRDALVAIRESERYPDRTQASVTLLVPLRTQPELHIGEELADEDRRGHGRAPSRRLGAPVLGAGPILGSP